MSDVIAASKAKCKNCQAPVVRVRLLPTRGYVYIDKEPVKDGRVVVVNPGIPGDKRRPCEVAYVSRSLKRTDATRYQQHACAGTRAA